MGQLHSLSALRYRTVWISDVHLGFRGCSADLLLDFLRRLECETLYLVGDIVDIWNLRRGVYWPRAHNDVVRTILGKARHGTRVIYVPGNHDELFRDHDGGCFGDVEIRSEYIHETRDGRRLLVVHGDEFDSVVKCNRWLAMLGTRAYDVLLAANRWFNLARRRLGMGYWSLAGYLKHRVKNAVNYISNFEEAVAREAARRGVDGLVCGHIHHAEIRDIRGVLYLNCGDWVESNTALVEHPSGRIELLRWADVVAREARGEPLPAAA